MEKHMDRNHASWERLAEEGDQLFNYLTHNYEDMLDGEDKIKHFGVTFGHYHLIGEVRVFHIDHRDELQKLLVPWIKHEFATGDLMNENNWKPFRDQDLIIYMYLGYRKMFQYKQFIFQLTLSNGCEVINCSLCDDDDWVGYLSHFGLSLYGWKDANHVKLQPTNLITILDDNMIPDSYWARKE